uniref:Uncharacterized protein n=1 Tax=Oryza meridionalis TaxID=40149 RepID=A0A0E0CP48_9ORYZ
MAAAASALTSLSATEMRRAAGQEGAVDLRWAMVSAFAASSRGSATTAAARSAQERERPDPSLPTKELASTSRTAASRQRSRRLGGPAKEQRRQATQQARARRASRAGGATRRADGDSASGRRSIADRRFNGHEHAELHGRRLGGGAACGVAAATDVEVDDRRPGGGAAPGDKRRQGTGGAATEPSGRWLERVTPFSPSKWDRLGAPRSSFYVPVDSESSVQCLLQASMANTVVFRCFGEWPGNGEYEEPLEMSIFPILKEIPRDTRYYEVPI